MGIKESYTAASSLPAKLFHNKVIDNGKIVPLHIQLSPTNACNLSCSFCSCNDRDKSKKLTYDEIENILYTSSKFGTKAVTITGGGEPLMYKKINEVIDCAEKYDMEVGLVTNGILLNKLKRHDNLTWARISSSDDRVPAYETIEDAIYLNYLTDWSFSHVVTSEPNYNIVEGLVNFANVHDFSHIRLVSDLFDLDNVPNMVTVKTELKYNRNLDDSKVIYQGRKDSTPGTKNCLISLLKPVISPEGIFPCCGTQYAIHGQDRDMIDEMKCGDLDDLFKFYHSQKPFDGSKCDVCYYSQYNDALEKMINKPDHLRFV